LWLRRVLPHQAVDGLAEQGVLAVQIERSPELQHAVREIGQRMLAGS